MIFGKKAKTTAKTTGKFMVYNLVSINIPKTIFKCCQMLFCLLIASDSPKGRSDPQVRN